MKNLPKLKTFSVNLLNVPSENPDEFRRKRLLNIILFAVVIITSLTAILSALLVAVGIADEEGTSFILFASVGTLIGTVIIYFINRFFSGYIASTLFLILITVALTQADTPSELANGRSLFLFVIPIVIASVLLGPSASFIFYIFSVIEISIITVIAKETLNIPVIITFLLIAWISWLSSRSLEQALQELREININLDNIVKERTHALAEALTRERIEAGRSKAILESIADGVVVFDAQGIAIQANPALSNLIDLPLKGIVNTTVDELIRSSPMNTENKRALVDLLTEPGQEFTVSRVDWGHKTLSVSSGQVLDNDGSKLGIVAVFRDFTKEAELEKMKSAFVAMVSHELRTPLSAILGYAEIFLEQIYGPLNEKQLNMTLRVVTNSKRLLNLINDLLDQAQMEAGKLKIEYKSIQTVNLLENLHSVMDKLAADKDLTLTSHLDESMPKTLIGDSARLQQILVNLTNNAVKFTKEGSVHVEISKLNEMQWGITVTDTGRGIPKDELPFIFDPFRQVERSATRIHGGFGLGLSIVKQLINLMGGSISVSSEVSEGSTFSVILPFETTSKLEDNIS